MNGTAKLIVSQHYHYSKDNENQLSADEGRFILFISAFSSNAISITFEINKKLLKLRNTFFSSATNTSFEINKD
jgi:hypothetical protein